jgi:hypothetical protein
LANDGFVIVSPLENKPLAISLDAWFAKVESSENQNPETARLSFILNGLPALKVRYINTNMGGAEIEEVYVVSGSRTFSIEFSGDHAGRLETLRNFPVYTKMVESFKVRSSVAKVGDSP